MRIVVLLLVVVALGQARIHRALAPLATEFIESPDGKQGDDIPDIPDQVFSQQPYVVTPTPMVAIQPNAAGELQTVPLTGPGAVTIQLPSPPPYIPDPPEPVVAGCTGDDCNSLRARLGRNKVMMLQQRILAKQAVLDAHDNWLQDAHTAAERLTKQIAEIAAQRDKVQQEMDALELNEAAAQKQLKRDMLQAELDRAQANLRDVTRQTDQLASAHRAIDARAQKLQESMLGLGKQLNWDTQDVEKKLQEFNDANSALASIGDETNPDQPENDITAAPTDEAEEEQAAAEEDEASQQEEAKEEEVAEGKEGEDK